MSSAQRPQQPIRAAPLLRPAEVEAVLRCQQLLRGTISCVDEDQPQTVGASGSSSATIGSVIGNGSAVGAAALAALLADPDPRWLRYPG